MGEIGEAFKAYRNAQKNLKQAKENERFAYAKFRLDEIGAVYEREDDWDYLLVHFDDGYIRFFPFTGWYQGLKPHLTKINGRGINNLIEILSEVKDGTQR